MQGEKAKSIIQLQNERVKKLMELGEVIHNKIRKGEIDSLELMEISKEISELDKEIFLASKATDDNHCPNCNEKLEDGAKFCSKCGTSINEYYEQQMKKCDECRELTPVDSNFCMVCGRKIG